MTRTQAGKFSSRILFSFSLRGFGLQRRRTLGRSFSSRAASGSGTTGLLPVGVALAPVTLAPVTLAPVGAAGVVFPAPRIGRRSMCEAAVRPSCQSVASSASSRVASSFIMSRWSSSTCLVVVVVVVTEVNVATVVSLRRRAELVPASVPTSCYDRRLRSEPLRFTCISSCSV